MATIQGLRGTGDWATDERPTSFREYILWRDPNGDAPLQALMARMRSEGLTDPMFSWWEEELTPIRLQATAISTTGATTLTVGGGGGNKLVAGDVLMVENGDATPFESAPTAGANPFTGLEYLIVSSITSDTQVEVTRGQLGGGQARIITSAYVLRIGSIFEEGSGAPAISTRNPSWYYNYAQIFKTSYGQTKTAMQTKTRTGDSYANDKKRKAFDHATAMEFAYFFGRPYGDLEVAGVTTGVSNVNAASWSDQPKRATGGLLHFLGKAYAAGASHCVKVWTTTYDEDEFLDASYKVWDFRTGGKGTSNERLVLAGNGYLNALNKLAKNASNTQVHFSGVVETYGMKLQRWILPQGELYVRTHPLWNQHPRFTNAAVYINPNAIVDRPLRKTKDYDDSQANDEDRKEGYWLTESGPEFHHLTTMLYMGNAGV